MAVFDPFPAQWQEGMHAEEIVKKRFERCGVRVTRPVKTCRPHIDDRHKHSDKGDLFLLGTKWIIEVKSRRRAFSDAPHSYPFARVLVDSVAAVSKWQWVCAAVVCSQLTKAMIVIPASSRPTWHTGPIKTKYGVQLAYFVDKHHLKQFSDLSIWAKSCQAKKKR